VLNQAKNRFKIGENISLLQDMKVGGLAPIDASEGKNYQS
jgi:hypothetical protein